MQEPMHATLEKIQSSNGHTSRTSRSQQSNFAFFREAAPLTLQERIKQVGGWGYRWYKVVRRTWREWTGQEGIPFDQAFPEALKLNRTAPQHIPTPELRGVPFMPEARHHKQGGGYTTPEDYVAVLDDALYCPFTNLLLSEDRQVVAESLSTEMLGNRPLETEAEYLPGCYALLRSHHKAYYHMLVDNAPRLLAFNQPPFTEIDEIKFLCPEGGSPMETYLFERLAPENAVIVTPEDDHLYRVEKMLFTPFKSKRYAPCLPSSYVRAFQARVLPNRPSRQTHRAFISRENAPWWRQIENRDELMKALAGRGFESVRAEDFSPEEEVEFFYDAEAIVGATGSGLTNMIFAKTLKVVELAPMWFMVPHYYYLSKSIGHTYGLWSGPGNRWMAPSFKVDIPGVLRLLDRMDIR